MGFTHHFDHAETQYEFRLVELVQMPPACVQRVVAWRWFAFDPDA